MNVLAEDYTESYLKASSKWLTDAEIKAYTRASDFSPEDQKRWFDQLRIREDYKIWGISIDRVPIGAFGLKNIIEQNGEFWGYIGEKQYWGIGIGDWMIESAEKKAGEAGLKSLCLNVFVGNYKAVNLYFKHKYRIKYLAKDDQYFMCKDL